jgi:octopamine receptor
MLSFSGQVWIFGDVWCSIWLAVDVWMCTASILNLCAISLDRYVAVTRPVTYPSIMSSSRAKLLIAGNYSGFK